MFKDRDIAILGAGALLAILTALLLPFSLPWKVLLSLLIMVFFMFLALLRLGPDRITPEEWLKRRILFRLRARRYVYQQKKPASAQPTTLAPAQVQANASPQPQMAAVGPPQKASRPRPKMPQAKHSLSVGLAFDEIGIYPLVTVFLAVVGVWFVIWVAQGGGVELSRIFER